MASGDKTKRRALGPEHIPEILPIINAAALAYEGVIPADRWHEPYMQDVELAAEIDAGVAFTGLEIDGLLVAVIGLQPVRDVWLIRHAYVSPEHQGSGLGSLLLQDLLGTGERPMLVGTWATASWAIGFYEKHGFTLAAPELAADLLERYWRVPEAQARASVVLMNAAFSQARR